jgi:hypothetical protein
MASSQSTEVSIDRARQTLCRHTEYWCEQGVSNVRIRVNTTLDEPESVWFYGHLENKWLKAEDTIAGSEFARLIHAEMERLATNPNSEECQVRRKEFRGRIDFEIKFHHDKIIAHQGKKLGSYLYGILFHERRAAPNSSRQGIHSGPRRPAVRL